jgi:hypothetical protein
MPLAEMVPPVADQVTLVLLEPVTVAVNCWVWPVCTLTEPGVTATATETEPAGEPDNEQPARESRSSEKMTRINLRAGVSKAACWVDFAM